MIPRSDIIGRANRTPEAQATSGKQMVVRGHLNTQLPREMIGHLTPSSSSEKLCFFVVRNDEVDLFGPVK